jgi:hypothetical protein
MHPAWLLHTHTTGHAPQPACLLHHTLTLPMPQSAHHIDTSLLPLRHTHLTRYYIPLLCSTPGCCAASISAPRAASPAAIRLLPALPSPPPPPPLPHSPHHCLSAPHHSTSADLSPPLLLPAAPAASPAAYNLPPLTASASPPASPQPQPPPRWHCTWPASRLARPQGHTARPGTRRQSWSGWRSSRQR